MFVSRFRRRKYFIIRLVASLAIMFTAVTFFPVRYDALYNSFMFLLFFVLTLGSVINLLCFKFRTSFKRLRTKISLLYNKKL